AEFKKDLPKMDFVYEPTPTSDSPTGMRGRMAVFEMFKMDKDLEKVILSGANEPAIRKVVREKGMLTMKEDAIIKALEKKIPFEEVNLL
ncbi:MAG: hypothetical protein WCW14_03995, partial [Candidatus Paceibacterota bacterium]